VAVKVEQNKKFVDDELVPLMKKKLKTMHQTNYGGVF
jgi:hypothetical protein